MNEEINDAIVEQHPLEPFLPAGAKLLMLGSFPPPRARWSMDFYYPNWQNDMWRILGLIFFGDKTHFLVEAEKTFQEAEIRLFLQEKGIAISDAARQIVRHRNNASDQFLEIITPIPLKLVLNDIPLCRAIVTTGQKATETLLSLTGARQPKVGEYSEFFFQSQAMKLYRMPSSSRAYPKSIEEKARMYERMFRELGILE